MKLKRGKRKMMIMVPVASMGDIAFLLIIFFMLASNFAKETRVELEEPESTDIYQMKEAQISVALDQDNSLWLQGAPCDISSLGEEVEFLISGRDDKMVMLKIDKNLTQKDYGKVFLELSKVGAEIALVGIKSAE